MFNKTLTHQTPDFEDPVHNWDVYNPSLQDTPVKYRVSKSKENGNTMNSFGYDQIVASFPNLNTQMNNDWNSFQISIVADQIDQGAQINGMNPHTDTIQIRSKKRKRDENNNNADHPNQNINANKSLPLLTTPIGLSSLFLHSPSSISALQALKSSIFSASSRTSAKPSIFKTPSHQVTHTEQQLSIKLSQREQYLFNAYKTLTSSEEFTDQEYHHANQMIEKYITSCDGNNFLDDMKTVLICSEDTYEGFEPDDQIPFQSLKSFCLFFGMNPSGIEKFQLDSKTKKFVLGKLYSAVNDQNGEFCIEGQMYACEGMNGYNTAYGFLYFLTQQLKEYFEDCKTTETDVLNGVPSCMRLHRFASIILEAFDLTSRFHSAAEMAARIREGKLCIVPSGYLQHALCIVFANGMMIVCNNCNDSNNNIVCYPIDPQKVSENDICELIKFRMDAVMRDDVCSFIYTKLPKKLACNHTLNKFQEMTINMINKQIIQHFNSFNLQAGTCVFQSFIYAVFVTLFISNFQDNEEISSDLTVHDEFEHRCSRAAQDTYLFVNDFIDAASSKILDRWEEESDPSTDRLNSSGEP